MISPVTHLGASGTFSYPARAPSFGRRFGAGRCGNLPRLVPLTAANGLIPYLSSISRTKSTIRANSVARSASVIGLVVNCNIAFCSIATNSTRPVSRSWAVMSMPAFDKSADTKVTEAERATTSHFTNVSK